MAAQIPENYHLSRPAKLDGDAAVSYPYGTDHRRIERYFTVPRGSPPTDWDSVDAEYSTATLTERAEIGGDAQNVYIYEVYEDLPGPLLADRLSDNSHGPVTRTRQKIAAAGNEEASITVSAGIVTRTTYESQPSTGVLMKVVETYQQNGEDLKGQEYDKQLGLRIPFIQRVEDFDDPAIGAPSLGTAADVSPIDTRSSSARIYDQAATNSALATIVRGAPARRAINLPTVLLGVAVTFRVNKGEGDTVSGGFGYSVGPSWSLSLTTPARANSSITIIPELTRAWKEFYGADSAEVMGYTFFVHGDFTESNLRTRLGEITGHTINKWPMFKTQGHDIAITGLQLSASATADIHRSKSYANGGNSISEMTVSTAGYSFETGANSSTITIHPSIHGFIAIANPTLTETLSVSALAVISAGTNFDGGSTMSGAPVQTLTATVSPTALPATSPAAVPTSGYYLLPDYEVTMYDAENWRVRATVVDMAQFLSYTIFATPNTAGFGTISGPGEYDPGATVTLIATPTTGHVFTNWKEGATTVSTSATYTFTASADRVLVATFT